MDKVYDFCLAWLMSEDKTKLMQQFKELQMSFDDFKSEAQKYNWFVSSMNMLR